MCKSWVKFTAILVLNVTHRHKARKEMIKRCKTILLGLKKLSRIWITHKTTQTQSVLKKSFNLLSITDLVTVMIYNLKTVSVQLCNYTKYESYLISKQLYKFYSVFPDSKAPTLTTDGVQLDLAMRNLGCLAMLPTGIHNLYLSFGGRAIICNCHI